MPYLTCLTSIERSVKGKGFGFDFGLGSIDTETTLTFARAAFAKERTVADSGADQWDLEPTYLFDEIYSQRQVIGQ